MPFFTICFFRWMFLISTLHGSTRVWVPLETSKHKTGSSVYVLTYARVGMDGVKGVATLPLVGVRTYAGEDWAEFQLVPGIQAG